MNLKIFTENIEDKAVKQIETLVTLPAFEDCKIRIMPDVHAGAGCVIGFTANLGDKVIPNIVGVDIGCGMRVVKLKSKDIDLDALDAVIKKSVPSGNSVHKNVVRSFDKIKDMYCYSALKNTKRFELSVGTLGGGNHFIEIDENSDGDIFLVIHTGSRNLGKQVAEHYQNLAIKTMRNDKSIPKELCYLTGDLRKQYLFDMSICQDYAIENRSTISDLILDGIGMEDEYIFETIHNYISLSDNIVRKGAISAKSGELVLIPMNMKDGCILGVGKGNQDWNESAPHGAGRIMSRTKAKSSLSLEAYKESMKDVYSTCINRSTLDEAPMAYKPMSEIISKIGDTIDIVDILKPIYNYKATE